MLKNEDRVINEPNIHAFPTHQLRPRFLQRPNVPAHWSGSGEELDYVEGAWSEGQWLLWILNVFPVVFAEIVVIYFILCLNYSPFRSCRRFIRPYSTRNRAKEILENNDSFLGSFALWPAESGKPHAKTMGNTMGKTHGTCPVISCSKKSMVFTGITMVLFQKNHHGFQTNLVGGGHLPLWKMMERKSVGMITFHSQYIMESHNPAMFQSLPIRHITMAISMGDIISRKKQYYIYIYYGKIIQMFQTTNQLYYLVDRFHYGFNIMEKSSKPPTSNPLIQGSSPWTYITYGPPTLRPYLAGIRGIRLTKKTTAWQRCVRSWEWRICTQFMAFERGENGDSPVELSWSIAYDSRFMAFSYRNWWFTRKWLVWRSSAGRHPLITHNFAFCNKQKKIQQANMKILFQARCFPKSTNNILIVALCCFVFDASMKPPWNLHFKHIEAMYLIFPLDLIDWINP